MAYNLANFLIKSCDLRKKMLDIRAYFTSKMKNLQTRNYSSCFQIRSIMCYVIIFICRYWFCFPYQGKNLEVVKSYCCLGIDLMCSGTFRTARINLLEKAQKPLFPLQAMIKQFQLPCKKSLELFHTLITPIALYNSENLAHLTHHQIKSVVDNKTKLLSYLTNSYLDITHQKFLKFLLGVKRNYSDMATLGELGECSLLVKAFVSLLSFWHRTTRMQDETFVRKSSTTYI